MTDQPVTPDREAHYCVRPGQECTHACPECNEDVAFQVEVRRRIFDPGRYAERSVDETLVNWQTRAVLPLLTDALDRARQQGRNEVLSEFRDAWERGMQKVASHVAKRITPDPWDACLDVDPFTGQPDQHPCGDACEGACE